MEIRHYDPRLTKRIYGMFLVITYFYQIHALNNKTDVEHR